MISRLRTILLTATARDSMILMGGTVVATASGFLLTVILARGITPVELGLFLTGLTFTQLVADLAELGINSALLNLLPPASPAERPLLVKTALMLRLIVSILISGLVFLLAPQISQLVFHSQTIIPFIEWASVGILLTMVAAWAQAVFQAQHQFFDSMLASSLINIFRLTAAVALVSLGLLTVFNVYIAAELVVLLVVIYCWIKMRPPLGFKLELPLVQKIASFGLPIGLSFSLAAIATKLDQILIFSLAGEREAGVYGLAFRVASAFIFASAALTSAITPRFARMARDDFLHYFYKTMLANIGLVLLVLIAIPVAPILLPLIFGQKFLASIVPFQILTVGAAIFILYAPFSTAITYHYKQPKFSIIVSTVALISSFILLNWLIPSYQSIGAALAVDLVYLFQLLIVVGYFLILKKRNVIK